MITLTVTGAAEAARALELAASPDLGWAIAEAVATEAALPRLREYPPASGRPQPFRSDKARRWFFAALRSGAISVPYRRTGELGRRWLHLRSGGDGLVYNSQSYAELVQGEKQADYFRGVWQSVDEVADAVERQEAAAVGERAAADFFRGAGL